MGNMTNTFFDNLDAAATWSAGVAFKRSKGLPLDKYSVFETKTLAIEYAEKRGAYAETPVSYPGQVIAVAEGNKMVAYVLAENAEGTKLELQQIGIIPTGDDKTIDVTENGVISLLAADTEVFKKDAEGNPTEEKEINAGAQLVLQADGTLKWVKPDTTTVEGLSTAVTDLQGRMTTAETDIDALEAKVGKAAEGETAATGLFKAIADEAKARDDADKALDAKIGAASVPETTEGAGDGKAATGVYVAIETEAARAKAAEKALDDAIKAIDFVDDGELATALAPYAKTDDVNKTLEDYAKTADVNKTLEDYATIEYVDGEIEAIEDAISKLNHFTTKIVNSEAEVTEEGVLYLIKDAEATGADVYNEYLFVDGKAVLIGDTTTDLSDYYTKGQVDTTLSGYYTKGEVDTALGGYYTKGQVDTALNAKADKVTSATKGNFAGLDENGNLTDSGKNADDFVQSITTGSASGTISVDGVDVLVKDIDVMGNGIGAAHAAIGSWSAGDFSESTITEEIHDIYDGLSAHYTRLEELTEEFNNYYKKSETYTQAEVNEAILVETNRAEKAEKANADAIAAIKDDATIDSFADVVAALAGKQAVGDYATKTEAQGYADAKDTAISAAQNKADSAYTLAQAAEGAAEAAQGTANTNAANIEELDKFLFGREAVEGAEAIEGLNTKVASNTTRIGTLEGTLGPIVNGTSSVPKAVEADTLDGKHAADFDASGAAAQALTDAKTWVGEQDYSTNTRVAALEGRIKAEEDKADNDTTYTFEDGTEGTFKVTAKGGQAQTVNTGAKDYVDGKVSTINSELDKKAVKSEVEQALNLKADASSVYTKDQVNTTLADYAKTADVPGIKVNAATTADKVANKLTVGNKTFDGSAAVEVTAADLGLESAMHFVGAFASAPASGNNGDVYLNTNTKKEYVYSDNAWIELGDEGSYALRTVTVTGVDGLTGGGDLTDNRTIGIADNGVVTAKIADKNVTKAKLADDVQTSLGKADSALQASDIGTMAKETASDYVKKTDAPGYDDILTKTAAATAYQPAGNYATAEQGAKADTAIQSVTSLHEAIVVTPGANGAITINFADEIILNGGGANVAAE